MSLIYSIYHKWIYPIYTSKDCGIDPEKIREFLDSLPKPADNIERSHNRYLCKYSYYSGIKKVLIKSVSTAAFLLAAFFEKLPAIPVSERFVPGKLVIEELKHLGFQDVIPSSLLEEYPDTVVIAFSNRAFGRLTQSAKRIFSECRKRYPKEYAYLFLVYKELAKHSAIIDKYNPEALTQYASERNIASPVVTELYESSGRKFVSFMHGDYLLQLIQAFMQYSKYYTWDEDYVRMFVDELRCDEKQFCVYTPKKLTKKYIFDHCNPEYFCTYYFSNEDKDTLKKLCGAFTRLKNAGKICKVRLHPRADANHQLIRDLFKDFYIEDPHEVSMEESFKSTEYVVGLASTVLHEAYVEGKPIVIDDVSSEDRYLNLKAKHYIMLNKKHLLLSELVNGL